MLMRFESQPFFEHINETWRMLGRSTAEACADNFFYVHRRLPTYCPNPQESLAIIGARGVLLAAPTLHPEQALSMSGARINSQPVRQ